LKDRLSQCQRVARTPVFKPLGGTRNGRITRGTVIDDIDGVDGE
jgi:hypothetical protein